jgi:short-subunit dehydrogenase
MAENSSSSARPVALVTGASSGIGYELANEFAKAGFDLIITAENEAIAEARDALGRPGVDVIDVRCDLTTREGVETLVDAAAALGRPLDVLALNAGVGISGDFVRETELDDLLDVIDLNVLAPVALAKRLLPAMVARGEGRVLFTSSIASLSPGPFNAVYHATKAFIESFAEALREELKDSGVTITTLLPGATETQFFARADMLDTKVGQGKKDDPAKVAKQGVEALMRGDDHVVAGSFANKVQAVLSKFLPDATKAKQVRGQNEPLRQADERADAIEMLTRQHREAEALFDRLEHAEPTERRSIFKTLALKLHEHMQIEEQIFYPAATAIVPGQIRQAEEEHAEAKETLSEALDLDEAAGDEALADLAADLKTKILAHVREEEHQVFPPCKKAMTDDELVSLADRMRAALVAAERGRARRAGGEAGYAPAP